MPRQAEHAHCCKPAHVQGGWAGGLGREAAQESFVPRQPCASQRQGTAVEEHLADACREGEGGQHMYRRAAVPKNSSLLEFR